MNIIGLIRTFSEIYIAPVLTVTLTSRISPVYAHIDMFDTTYIIGQSGYPVEYRYQGNSLSAG